MSTNTRVLVKQSKLKIVVLAAEVGLLHLLLAHFHNQQGVHRVLLEHGYVLGFEGDDAIVARPQRRRRRRAVVEEVRGDVEVVHADPAAGVLRPEVELDGEDLLRRRPELRRGPRAAGSRDEEPP